MIGPIKLASIAASNIVSDGTTLYMASAATTVFANYPDMVCNVKTRNGWIHSFASTPDKLITLKITVAAFGLLSYHFCIAVRGNEAMDKKCFLCVLGASFFLALRFLPSPDLPLRVQAATGEEHSILFDSSTNCPAKNGDYRAQAGIGIHPLSGGGYVQVHTECQSCAATYGSSSFATVTRSLSTIYYIFELSAIGLTSFCAVYSCSSDASIAYSSYPSVDYSGTPHEKDVHFSSGSTVSLSSISRSLKLEFSIGYTSKPLTITSLNFFFVC